MLCFLGYNYQSSRWYEASYKLLNKDYKKEKLLVIIKKYFFKEI